MVAVESCPYLIRSLMSERVRTVAGSSVVLTGRLSTEIIGVGGCNSSCRLVRYWFSNRAVGAEAGFALSSTINSSICRYACCSPIKVGANRSMVLLGAWVGCAAGAEVASLWPDEA